MWCETRAKRIPWAPVCPTLLKHGRGVVGKPGYGFWVGIHRDGDTHSRMSRRGDLSFET